MDSGLPDELELASLREENKRLTELLHKTRLQHARDMEESAEKIQLLEQRVQTIQERCQNSSGLLEIICGWMVDSDGDESPRTFQSQEDLADATPELCMAVIAAKLAAGSSTPSGKSRAKKKRDQGSQATSRCLLLLLANGTILWQQQQQAIQKLDLRTELFRLSQRDSLETGSESHLLEIEDEKTLHCFAFRSAAVRDHWFAVVRDVCGDMVSDASKDFASFRTYSALSSRSRSTATTFTDLYVEQLVSCKPTIESSFLIRPRLEFKTLGNNAVEFDGVTYRIHDLEPFRIYPHAVPYDRTYDPNHATWFSYLAHLAYGGHETVQLIVQNVFQWPELVFFDNADKDTHGFGCISDTFAVVVFRGTASSTNWLTNLDSAREPFFDPNAPLPDHFMAWRKKLLVHKGFKAAFLVVWADVHQFLLRVRETKGPDFPIYITGHSLGKSDVLFLFPHVFLLIFSFSFFLLRRRIGHDLFYIYIIITSTYFGP
ncbi:MAG: lipase family protein, partial [archaeon]|nr:lipase family protein [archaeon]